MKKKNVFKMACLGLALTMAPLVFSGCDAKEIESNTKVVAETATSIVPIEYSKELASSILMSAHTALMYSNYSVEITSYDGQGGSYLKEKTHSKISYIQTENGTCAEAFEGYNSTSSTRFLPLKDESQDFNYYMISDDYNGTGKKYLAIDDLNPMSADNIMHSLSYVTDGMCLNGISYINGSIEASNMYFSYQIKDNKILSFVVKTISHDYQIDCVDTIAEYTYSYENVTISAIPTTLAEVKAQGYTFSNWIS